MWDWDDDEDDETVDEIEEEEEEDDAELLARVERAYRSERSRIRACTDVEELRSMRNSYRQQLTSRTLVGVAAIRGNDLLEIIDDRITDLKAQQIAKRRKG